VKIELTVDDAGLTKALTKLSKSMGDLTPVMTAIGEDMRFMIWQGFEAERDPWGKSWAPLKNPSKRRAGGKILRDTGRLFNSIGYTVTPTSVSVGTSIEYGVFHQMGTKRMPARKFLPLTNSYKNLPKEYRQSIMDMLKEAVTL
jgi:phage virion morphogenesis protein